jgi:drug/metabolite transporter (DMT)-like permease
MLAVAALLLVGNYVSYLLGVQFTTPANAQLLIQLAPLLMALGGIWIFRERFRAAQWIGLGLTVAGLLLFFRDQLLAAQHAPGYGIGSAWIIAGAVVWAGYALLQKQLLAQLESTQVLFLLYVAASLALLPFAHPARLLRLDGLHWAMLAYCALNTIGAYGAFAEALAHWEASRVSAILATTPLLCIGVVALVHARWPALLAAEHIGVVGYAGAVLVVAGSAAVSLMGRRQG